MEPNQFTSIVTQLYILLELGSGCVKGTQKQKCFALTGPFFKLPHIIMPLGFCKQHQEFSGTMAELSIKQVALEASETAAMPHLSSRTVPEPEQPPGKPTGRKMFCCRKKTRQLTEITFHQAERKACLTWMFSTCKAA